MIRLEVQGTRWLASGSLGAESCESFRELLLLARDSSGDASVLDLSQVESIDMKGVQLLAAFLAASPASRIAAPSDVVRSFLERVGALSSLVKDS